ncbi:HutD family protein [Pseudoalteromonas sp. C2R02]|uniref:HutD/Ves family protein n=1 Tax=Pseudoalteromonas sp. C2R02 TaxID=2841565 RepID=UPI001C085416|nr:HutD family protein [Pseudoalteromonas sp. C2R02]MBU2970050.1 HutD family protein [Pseudoalteromonas sp. C2R02]
MNISIKTPAQFKNVPWKNGKGTTTELAINEGGTLECFDWRMSIASVAEDGLFSNFAGYTRNLTLIAGNGIDLHHYYNDVSVTHSLKSILDVSIFDGASATSGELHKGEILDFNVIVRTDKFSVETINNVALEQVSLEAGNDYFVYCLADKTKLTHNDKVINELALGHLMHITELTDNNVQLSGEMMIIIKLKHK